MDALGEVKALFGLGEDEAIGADAVTPARLTGPKALLLAMLREAVRSLSRQSPARTVALAWVESRVADGYPRFTFVQVCEELRLDPDAVRSRIVELAHRGASVSHATPRCSSAHSRAPGVEAA